MNRKQANSYFALIKGLLIGSGLTIFLLWAFFWEHSVNKWHEYHLIKYSETTDGELVNTINNEAEDARGRVKYWKSGIYKYEDSKGKNYMVASDKKYENIPNEVRVRFLPSNPSISDIEGEGAATLKQFGFFRMIVTGPILLCMLCTPGFAICRQAYREWLTAQMAEPNPRKPL